MKMIRNNGWIAAFFVGLLVCPFLMAQDIEPRPVWELGVFVGGVRIPHYRGADEYDTYVLPLPYFIYRGKYVQADRDSVRGIFYQTDKFETNISLYGNPPVDDDNEARKDMPELDAIFEIGPAFKWFFNSRASVDPLYLKAALRGAFSIDIDGSFNTAYRGLHGGINLIYNNRTLMEELGIAFSLNIGVDFADEKLNTYFYDVEEAYVRSDRPFYDADAGYAGLSISGSLQKSITETISFGVYSRWENVSGAVYEDSPLVKEKNNVIIGCALIWRFLESVETTKNIVAE